MTPDQITDFVISLRSALRLLPLQTRASLAGVGLDVIRLIEQSEIDVAKELVTITTNPPTSGLTDSQFATLQAQFLAMFP